MSQQYIPVTPSVGAVEIKIVNPTVNAAQPGMQNLPQANIPGAGTFVPQIPVQQPYYLPPNFTTQQYGYMQPGMQFLPQMGQMGVPNSAVQIPCPYPYYYPLPPVNLTPQQGNSQTPGNLQLTPQPQQLKSEENLALPQTNNEQAKKPETKPDPPAKPEEANNEQSKKALPPPLSDEYIKLLESNLRDKNPNKRLDGAKELFKRLKEHESRKDDPALMNLLNVALGDPFYGVRFVALCALKGKYAKPNDKTYQILKELENNNSSDSQLASQIRLKLAAPDTNQSTSAAKNIAPSPGSVGKNLNMQSPSDGKQNVQQPPVKNNGKLLNLISK